MISYTLLGILQGITEFLPVSSSAHLVIMQKILGITSQELALSVVLHLGTTLALVIFFFRDILKLLRNTKMLLYIIIVTVITGIIGLAGKGFFEYLFSAPKLVAMALIFTGIVLIFTKRIKDAKRDVLNAKDAFILGIVQGLAIIPGVSRSGITISALLFRKINRETSFRFSLVASIPAILGATLLEAKSINHVYSVEPRNFVVGFAFSFLTGILSLWILRLILFKSKLYYFGYYCIIAAIITLLFIR